MTLRGQSLAAPPPYPLLQGWIEQAQILTDAVFAAAEHDGLDEAGRKNFRLHLEGRDISMQTILAAVRHNLTQEYPLLLKSNLEHKLTALYAFNLNDRYRVTQLTGTPGHHPRTQTALNRLRDHLAAIPSGPDI